MISRMRIENFRSHEQTEFTLEPLTVFVGPCASGKSNIFGALALLQSTANRPLQECFTAGLYDFPMVRSLWLRGSESIALEVDVTSPPGFPGWRARYRLAVTKGGDLYQVTEERLDAEEPDASGGRKLTCFNRKWRNDSHPPYGYVRVSDPTLLYQLRRLSPDARESEDTRLAEGVTRTISRFGYYRPDSSAIHTPSSVETSARLGYHGENMAACLNYLKQEGRIAPVEEKLLAFSPQFKGILVQELSFGKFGFSFLFEGFGEPVPAPLLSDGVKLSLAYLVISALAAPPLILCLEEPENGYHPRRLRELMDIFVRLAYPNDDTPPVQVLVSTHSPYLLDHFSGEMEKCIRVVEVRDGRSVVGGWLDRKASLTPGEAAAGRELPIGELWTQGLYGGV